MPRLPRGLRRPAAAFLLLLHLTLVGGWVVHAVALRSDPAVTHLASDGTHDGPRLHDARDCQVCQAATLPVLPGTVVTLVVTTGQPPIRGPLWSTAVRLRGSASRTQPRAPPPAVS